MSNENYYYRMIHSAFDYFLKIPSSVYKKTQFLKSSDVILLALFSRYISSSISPLNELL